MFKIAFVRKDIDENIYIKNISNLKKLPEAIDNCLKMRAMSNLWQRNLYQPRDQCF